ncbi:MAG TPA: CesT family type III secretion system chaperone [Polyangiaceae bacterium]|nr:CesT family type III secretion system chaperone [Polyangiaceae bacterium]
MIRTSDDLEAQLGRLGRRYERTADGTFILSLGASNPPAALLIVPPVLVVQVAIGEAPADGASAAPVYKKLLELNASALLHAAFGLENDQIVLAAALELDSLDLNELEAVLADIDVALGEHVPLLRSLVQSASS